VGRDLWRWSSPIPVAHCRGSEQGGNKQSGGCSLLTPAPPHCGRERGGNGRENYKLNIRTALLITLIILIIGKINQNIQNRY